MSGIAKTCSTLVLLVAAWTASRAAEHTIEFAEINAPVSGTLLVGITDAGVETPAAQAVDRLVGGLLARSLAETTLKPDARRVLLTPEHKVVLIGLGEHEHRRSLLENLGGQAAQAMAEDPGTPATLIWDDGQTTAADGAHLAFGARLGGYRFDRYKSPEDPENPAAANHATLTIQVPASDQAEAQYRTRWAPVAEAVTFTRDLISEPANVVYPASFVERTQSAFADLDRVEIEVLDEDEIAARGMGALAGVGQGSARPPRLLAVRYSGGEPGQAPLAFVGKGITFDTGGISLKDGNSVWKMKYDMAGAAAAVGAVLALARRSAKVNAVGVAALAENMPSGTAQRPGDVVTTGSGKTIEVLNTDAEGRLVLSDGVWFAQEMYAPAVLVDLATLTGSVSVALGDEYAGAFSRDPALIESIILAGETSGEGLWHLPLHPSYAKDIESDIADIKNVSGHRLAGAGVGAQVIGTFVDEDQPWIHLDIAGMAWREEAAATVPKGAVGFGVRLLDTWAESYEPAD